MIRQQNCQYTMQNCRMGVFSRSIQFQFGIIRNDYYSLFGCRIYAGAKMNNGY